MYYQEPREEDMDRRKLLLKVEWIMWAVLGILQFLLGLRLIYKLLDANAIGGFGAFIVGITGVIIAPLGAVLRIPALSGAAFEMTTLAAMAAYLLFFWIIISINGTLISRTTRISMEPDNLVMDSSYDQDPLSVLDDETSQAGVTVSVAATLTLISPDLSQNQVQTAFREGSLAS